MTFRPIDILMLIIMGRVLSRGYKNGLIKEFFQVIEVYCATLLTFHFYAGVSGLLKSVLFFVDRSGDLWAYIFLSIFILVFFSLLREGWLTLLKVEISPVLDKIGGVLAASVRSLFVCALVYVGIFVMGHPLLISLSENSYSSHFIGRFAVNVYRSAYEKGIAPLFPSEPLNKDFFRVLSPVHPEDQGI